jgi:citrate-Mg2+:H+ or citrate-Ca2+:H+ symporter, CitMHS family
MLSAVGFILVLVMVVLIIRGKIALPPILILLPTIATIILGLAGALSTGDGGTAAMGILDCLKTLKTYLDSGLKSVLNTACLFTFAVIFFNVLGDAGMFDTIVAKAMKYIGNNIGLILIMTCLLTTISHLDGSGATTMLINIPTMLPLFKKMKLSPILLLLYVGLVSGVVNMLPWTSALARVSAATGVEAREIWTTLLPVQIIGLVILYGSCFVVGPLLKKKGYGMTDEEFAELKSGMLKPVDPVLKVSHGVLVFDIILTVVLVLCMLFGWINTNVAFMVGLSIALIVNCKDSKEMTSQIKKHGSNALNMVMIIFSIGMLVGVMKESGMMSAMTTTLVGILPESMGKHLIFLIALVSVPLSMLVGSDTVYMVMTPIFGEMAVAFGGTALQACCATVIGSCISANLCLVGPTPYLALGLAGVEMQDNLKKNFVPTWVLGIVLAIIGAIIGAFPF